MITENWTINMLSKQSVIIKITELISNISSIYHKNTTGQIPRINASESQRDGIISKSNRKPRTRFIRALLYNE